tara:strand:- start:1253 stop:1546 length:294 start_codon:yes stop_codon:yes gene_type:complete
LRSRQSETTPAAAAFDPVKVQAGQSGNVTLVVRDVSRSRMIAQIDPGAVQGPERAVARKGALLDTRAGCPEKIDRDSRSVVFHLLKNGLKCPDLVTV